METGCRAISTAVTVIRMRSSQRAATKAPDGRAPRATGLPAPPPATRAAGMGPGRVGVGAVGLGVVEVGAVGVAAADSVRSILMARQPISRLSTYLSGIPLNRCSGSAPFLQGPIGSRATYRPVRTGSRRALPGA